MARDPTRTLLFHITDISNLAAILDSGGLFSDATLAIVGHEPTAIGYANIKLRRLVEIKVGCCGGRCVGEFVPFYFCPRSPMLYSINRGNTGREPGCQRSILHLVSTFAEAITLDRPWAISNGNAGAYHADFFADPAALDLLDWQIIESNDWAGETRRHRKSAEMLVADFFPWNAVRLIGCQNAQIKTQVEGLIANQAHKPKLVVRADWYY